MTSKNLFLTSSQLRELVRITNRAVEFPSTGDSQSGLDGPRGRLGLLSMLIDQGVFGLGAYQGIGLENPISRTYAIGEYYRSLQNSPSACAFRAMRKAGMPLAALLPSPEFVEAVCLTERTNWLLSHDPQARKCIDTLLAGASLAKTDIRSASPTTQAILGLILLHSAVIVDPHRRAGFSAITDKPSFKSRRVVILATREESDEGFPSLDSTAIGSTYEWRLCPGGEQGRYIWVPLVSLPDVIFELEGIISQEDEESKIQLRFVTKVVFPRDLAPKIEESIYDLLLHDSKDALAKFEAELPQGIMSMHKDQLPAFYNLCTQNLLVDQR